MYNVFRANVDCGKRNWRIDYVLKMEMFTDEEMIMWGYVVILREQIYEFLE